MSKLKNNRTETKTDSKVEQDVVEILTQNQARQYEKSPDNFPSGARYWPPQEVEQACSIMREQFRQTRFAEPKADYLVNYHAMEVANRHVIGRLKEVLLDQVSPTLLAEIVGQKDMFVALRYLCAPIISEDDLRTLVGDSIAPKRIREDATRAASIREIIAQSLDPKRFSWIGEKRAPTGDEVERAILASSVYAAGERSKTQRRTQESSDLEARIRQAFRGCGMQPMKVRDVDKLGPGQFAENSCNIAGHNADAVARLYDGRILAVECKSSNSEVNSRKRVNKEIIADAASWIEHSGQNIIPAAAIQGVFKPVYVTQAQVTPIVFFWVHALEELTALVEASKEEKSTGNE